MQKNPTTSKKKSNLYLGKKLRKKAITNVMYQSVKVDYVCILLEVAIICVAFIFLVCVISSLKVLFG